MKFPLYTLVIILLSGLLAQAQETPARAAKAQELLSLLNVDKTMETALSQVAKMQDQMMGAKSLSPEAKEKQAKMSKLILDETRNIFSWETIEPAFIQIYAETFSEEELQGMIDFFKSPIGQKWIEKQPQLQVATMQKMQSLMLEAQPKIQAVIKKAIEAEKPTPAGSATPASSVNPPFVK